MNLGTEIALAEFRLFVSFLGIVVFLMAMWGTKHPARTGRHKRRARP